MVQVEHLTLWNAGRYSWHWWRNSGDGNFLSSILQNFLIHWSFLSLIPEYSSFSNKFWWHTLSKALLKSSSMLPICSLWFIDFARLFTVLINCISQDRCFLKPCCRSIKMLLFSKCFMLLLCNICSKTLHEMDVKLIGLYFLSLLRSFFPPLNNGDIRASIHVSGMSLWRHTFFSFLLYPWKETQKLHKILLHHLELLRPTTKIPGNSTWHFLITPGNSMLFLLNPLEI